jgi:hypothetical protein
MRNNKKTMEKERKLFISHAFFLWEHKDRILQDDRMCYCPVHMGNNLAYVHINGIATNTLGGYLTWWSEFERSRRKNRHNCCSFIYFLGGSPLSGMNHCGEVFESGKTKTITVSPFKDYWKSFAEVQNRFLLESYIVRAYSLETVIDILEREGAYNTIKTKRTLFSFIRRLFLFAYNQNHLKI